MRARISNDDRRLSWARHRFVGVASTFPVQLKGATHPTGRIAAAIDLASRPLRLELDEIRKLQTPCILHWDLNHFVVLKSTKRGELVIHDPASGPRTLSLAETSAHFTGVALELTPTPAFRNRRERQEIRLREMMGKVVGLKRSLAQVLLLALALEVFGLVAPFFNQWVVDQAIVTGDRDLLLILALGFGLLAIIQVATEAIRSWAVTVMSTTLSVQWLANVSQAPNRLPIPYFESATWARILSRFGSVNTIQDTLTTSFIEAILDGLMTVGTLSMMLLYSPSLTTIRHRRHTPLHPERSALRQPAHGGEPKRSCSPPSSRRCSWSRSAVFKASGFQQGRRARLALDERRRGSKIAISVRKDSCWYFQRATIFCSAWRTYW
jgi:ATP-binding cassette subfamily B protein RaxB